ARSRRAAATRTSLRTTDRVGARSCASSCARLWPELRRRAAPSGLRRLRRRWIERGEEVHVLGELPREASLAPGDVGFVRDRLAERTRDERRDEIQGVD